MFSSHLEEVIFQLSALSPLEKEAVRWYLKREQVLRHAIKWTPLTAEEYENNLDIAIANKDAELLALISCQKVFTDESI